MNVKCLFRLVLSEKIPSGRNQFIAELDPTQYREDWFPGIFLPT